MFVHFLSYFPGTSTKYQRRSCSKVRKSINKISSATKMNPVDLYTKKSTFVALRKTCSKIVSLDVTSSKVKIKFIKERLHLVCFQKYC